MNKKDYQKLLGKCSIHNTKRRPEKFWKINTLCEVNACLWFLTLLKKRKTRKQLRKKLKRLLKEEFDEHRASP